MSTPAASILIIIMIIFIFYIHHNYDNKQDYQRIQEFFLKPVKPVKLWSKYHGTIKACQLTRNAFLKVSDHLRSVLEELTVV